MGNKIMSSFFKRKDTGVETDSKSSGGFFSSLGFKGKIYLAMGSLCLLLALVAALSLKIIQYNLVASQNFERSGEALLGKVKTVSTSLKKTLEEQQEQHAEFVYSQRDHFRNTLQGRVELYGRILKAQSAMAAVERNASLIIYEGESYSVVAADVADLKKQLEAFYNIPELEFVDPKKVKGAKRAGKAYLNIYEEVRQLDEENVSMSQQIELITESVEIGKSLQKRIAGVVTEVKKYVAQQMKEENQITTEIIENERVEARKTLQRILSNQKQIRETVDGNVGETRELKSDLLENRNYLMVVTFVALLLGVIFSIGIVRLISKPLLRAVEIAREIAGGDLDQVVDISGKDEIGQLGQSMELMIKKLRANRMDMELSVGNINDVSSSVAASIQEISASMEEINSMTRTNSDKAQRAEEMGTDAKVNAESGAVKVGDMVTSMQEVNKASEEIAKIVKVIEGIAFQTKLLALNAAVEAAHAGEQGQGFAVVAEEVRSLAGRCEEAVRDTTALIDGPIRKIGFAVDLADQTAESFNIITGHINNMADLSKEIVTSSKEQVLGIGQTNEGISRIDQAAQGLSVQVAQLHSIMDTFRCSMVEDSPTGGQTPNGLSALPEQT